MLTLKFSKPNIQDYIQYCSMEKSIANTFQFNSEITQKLDVKELRRDLQNLIIEVVKKNKRTLIFSSSLYQKLEKIQLLSTRLIYITDRLYHQIHSFSGVEQSLQKCFQFAQTQEQIYQLTLYLQRVIGEKVLQILGRILQNNFIIQYNSPQEQKNKQEFRKIKSSPSI